MKGWSYSIIASERPTSTKKRIGGPKDFSQRFFYKFTLLLLRLSGGGRREEGSLTSSLRASRRHPIS